MISLDQTTAIQSDKISIIAQFYMVEDNFFCDNSIYINLLAILIKLTESF